MEQHTYRYPQGLTDLFFCYLYPMTPEEYEAAFHGIDLPPTIQFDSGASTSDVPGFIESQIRILKHNGNGRVADSVRERLDLALKIISDLSHSAR